MFMGIYTVIVWIWSENCSCGSISKWNFCIVGHNESNSEVFIFLNTLINVCEILIFFLDLFDNVSDKDGVLGDVPQTVIDEAEEQLRLWHKDHIDLVSPKLL